MLAGFFCRERCGATRNSRRRANVPGALPGFPDRPLAAAFSLAGVAAARAAFARAAFPGRFFAFAFRRRFFALAFRGGFFALGFAGSFFALAFRGGFFALALRWGFFAFAFDRGFFVCGFRRFLLARPFAVRRFSSLLPEPPSCCVVFVSPPPLGGRGCRRPGRAPSRGTGAAGATREAAGAARRGGGRALGGCSFRAQRSEPRPRRGPAPERPGQRDAACAEAAAGRLTCRLVRAPLAIPSVALVAAAPPTIAATATTLAAVAKVPAPADSHDSRRSGDRAEERPESHRPASGVVAAECADDVRVELAPGLRAQDVYRLAVRARSAVRPRGGDRVECVGDGDDASAERDLLAAQSVGVAAAVEALVVVADYRSSSRHRAPRPCRRPRPGAA